MKIVGKEKFDKQLAALPGLMREEIRRALEVSAEEATDLMRRFVPVDSGALRASIGHSMEGGAPQGATLKTGSTLDNARAAKREAGLSVTMFAGNRTAYYAGMVEFGTVKTPAQGFFFPGYRLARKRAKGRLARAVRNGAKKAFAK